MKQQPTLLTVDTPYGVITAEFSRKKIKNFNLRVRADGSVAVTVPLLTTLSRAERFVAEHADWIAERRRRASEAKDTRPLSERGISFLGERFGVEFGGVKRVVLDREAGVLRLPEGADEDAVCRWLDARAREILPAVYRDALNFALATAPWLFTVREEADGQRTYSSPAPPEPKLRSMKSRWGSCNLTRGEVTLSTALVQASVECIEGVVFHELAHFASIRHDAAFYEALSGLSPEWKALKKRLMAQAPLFLQPKKKK